MEGCGWKWVGGGGCNDVGGNWVKIGCKMGKKEWLKN